MNDNAVWLSRITRNSKGIWGIITPLGTSFDANLIAKNAGANCEIRVVKTIFLEDGTVAFESDNGKSSDFSKLLEELIAETQDNLRNSCCLILECFNNLDPIQQFEIVKASRGVQESQSQTNCKVVLIGNWNYFSFRTKYREIHGLTTSPAVESKNILRLPAWDANDVKNLLSQERVIAGENSHVEKVAIEFLTEQTAGDEFLLRLIVKELVEQHGDWKVNLEQILYEAASSIAMSDEIDNRLRKISKDAFKELQKILQVHKIIRDVESAEIEELWLAGLICRKKLDGKRNYVNIGNPVVNSVIRNILQSKKSLSVASYKYLCFDRHAISSAAYCTVAVIENLLRNMIISVWYAELGEDWQNNLAATKTSSRAREEDENLVRFTIATVKTELLSLGLGRSDDAPIATDVNPGPRQMSVLDSALDWQRRQVEHHGVDLDHVSVMHFLTTESLEAVLCNKRNGLHGTNKPFKKESLMAVLEEYRAIRSAIAHNQPVKLNTVLRLEDILRKIVEWNTVFSDQFSFEANEVLYDSL